VRPLSYRLGEIYGRYMEQFFDPTRHASRAGVEHGTSTQYSENTPQSVVHRHKSSQVYDQKWLGPAKLDVYTAISDNSAHELQNRNTDNIA